MIRTLISPSNLHRRRLCPGSAAIERDLPGSTSAQAEEGTLGHLHLQHRDRPRGDLSSSLREAIEWIESAESQVLASLCAKHGVPPKPTLDQPERELWITQDGTQLAAGHVDRLLVWEAKLAILFDYKLGIEEVESADVNWQVRGYTAMVAEEFDVPFYYGVILQPRCFGQRQHSVVFDRAQALAAHAEVLSVIRDCEGSTELEPSPAACRYCRGLETLACPAVRGLPELVCRLWGERTAKSLADMPPADRTKVLDLCDVAKDVVKARADEAKGLLAIDPNSIPLWSLKSGGALSKIQDVLAAWRTLNSFGLINAERFISACSVGVGDLTDAVAAHGGIAKKEARTLIDDRLKDVIKTTPKSPSLSRQ